MMASQIASHCKRPTIAESGVAAATGAIAVGRGVTAETEEKS
jgi:hypothetical protein